MWPIGIQHGQRTRGTLTTAAAALLLLLQLFAFALLVGAASQQLREYRRLRHVAQDIEKRRENRSQMRHKEWERLVEEDDENYRKIRKIVPQIIEEYKGLQMRIREIDQRMANKWGLPYWQRNSLSGEKQEMEYVMDQMEPEIMEVAPELLGLDRLKKHMEDLKNKMKHTERVEGCLPKLEAERIGEVVKDLEKKSLLQARQKEMDKLAEYPQETGVDMAEMAIEGREILHMFKELDRKKGLREDLAWYEKKVDDMRAESSSQVIQIHNEIENIETELRKIDQAVERQLNRKSVKEYHGLKAQLVELGQNLQNPTAYSLEELQKYLAEYGRDATRMKELEKELEKIGPHLLVEQPQVGKRPGHHHEEENYY